MDWAFDYMQRDGEGDPDERTWLRDETGGSVYLQADDAPARTAAAPARMQPSVRASSMAATGCASRGPNCRSRHRLSGLRCARGHRGRRPHRRSDRRDIGVLAVTSADRLNAGWTAATRARARGQPRRQSQVERLLQALPPHCPLITVTDGHPATLAWLGARAWAMRCPAGRRAFRPDRHDRRSLPPFRHRRRRHRRRRQLPLPRSPDQAAGRQGLECDALQLGSAAGISSCQRRLASRFFLKLREKPDPQNSQTNCNTRSRRCDETEICAFFIERPLRNCRLQAHGRWNGWLRLCRRRSSLGSMRGGMSQSVEPESKDWASCFRCNGKAVAR